MKSIIMFTDRPLDYIECKKVLEPLFPKIIINEQQVFYGYSPNSFNFDFEYERDQDSIDPLPKDMADRIPVKNPYCVNLNFHKENMVKKIVAALYPLYPELFIYEDQIDWYGTAKEYIDLDYSKYEGYDYCK